MKTEYKNKKFKKFLIYQFKKYSYIQDRIEETLERLKRSGYTDIRTIFAGTPFMKDLTIDRCAPDEINVFYIFGDILKSPVDQFSLAELREMVHFCEIEVSKIQKLLKEFKD